MSAEKTCFLVLTTKVDKTIVSFVSQLKKATSSLGDVILLYHATEEPVPAIPGVRIHYFTNALLHNLGYKPLLDRLVPGSNHFPVLQFFQQNPEYRFYWCIEDDVRFRGDWSSFFKKIQQGPAYDLITSHIRRECDEPGWYWWQHLVAPDGACEKKDLLSSFNPIYRISNEGLQALHNQLIAGWSGHHEVVMPTILRKEGFQLADLGSESNEITPVLGFCTLRTMRWKPVILLKGLRRNTLYHPVKSPMSYGQIRGYLKRLFLNRMKYEME